MKTWYSHWKFKIFLQLSVLCVLNFVVTLGWPISQKQTSKTNHLFLDNTSFDVSNLPSCKYASMFLNEANTILITKTERQNLTIFFAANVKKWGFQSRLTLIVINRSLISAFNLYMNK